MKCKLFRENNTGISTYEDNISLLVAHQVWKWRSTLLWLLVVLEGEALPSGFTPLLFEYPNALHYRWRQTSSAPPRCHPAATGPATLLCFLELTSAPEWSQSFQLTSPEAGSTAKMGTNFLQFAREIVPCTIFMCVIPPTYPTLRLFFY